MSFIPAPNCIRLIVEGQHVDALIVNTFHFVGSAPATQSKLNSILNSFDSWWRVYILPQLGPSYQVNVYRAYALDSIDAPMAEKLIASSNVGTYATGNALPSAVAACVTRYTAYRGRSGRGRVYLAGLTTTMLQDVDHLTEEYASDVVDAFGTLSGTMAAEVVTPCIVSFQLNKVARTAGFPEAITSYGMDLNLDTQRRRGPGRGA